MRHKLAAAFMITLLPLLLSGCWSLHELNNLSIVVGMGIDKVGDKFKVTVQLVNPGQVVVKKAGGNNFSPVITYEETGVTIPDALTRMTAKSPRRLYYAHMRIIIIGEDVARDGISRPLDFISRNREMRTDFYFVIARNSSASEVLKVTSPMDPIPANNMYSKLENSDKTWAATTTMTLDQLIKDLSRQGKSPVMTGIEILGNPRSGQKMSNDQRVAPPVISKYSGAAIFKSDRMVGWLNEDETQAMNYIQNKVTRSSGVLSCPHGKGTISLEIIRASSTIQSTMRNGMPEFDVFIRSEQDISAIECDIDIASNKFVDEVKELADKKMEQFLAASIAKVQKQYATDIYGFGDELHRENPRAWHKVDNWNELFRKVPIRFHADIHIRRIGTTMQSVKYEVKE